MDRPPASASLVDRNDARSSHDQIPDAHSTGELSFYHSIVVVVVVVVAVAVVVVVVVYHSIALKIAWIHDSHSKG